MTLAGHLERRHRARAVAAENERTILNHGLHFRQVGTGHVFYALNASPRSVRRNDAKHRLIAAQLFGKLHEREHFVTDSVDEEIGGRLPPGFNGTSEEVVTLAGAGGSSAAASLATVGY